MSKLMTDSKTLTGLLQPGSTPDDNTLTEHIEALKQCAFDCLELQVSWHVMTVEEIKKKTERMNVAIVEAWQTLSALKSDFADMLDPDAKGGEA